MKHLFTIIFSTIFSYGLLAQPINDDCSGIIDLGEIPYCSAPAQYTNVDATASNIDPLNNIPVCFTSGGVARDVWFQFTVPADGSILDVTVSVLGNTAGNGTMQNPQVAVYRGDCVFEGLAELDCASAPNGVNEVTLDLFGLTPGLTYFLRINDYSASATPNAGTFRLCVEEYVANIIMGETLTSSSCTGTLFDSGGEGGDYSSGENLTFSVCPQDFTQCIIFNVVEYNTEAGFDFLGFYVGPDLTGIEVIQLDGSGSNFEVQIPTQNCATVAFSSDGSIVDQGFQITWQCSPNPCTIPPFVTCDEPVNIPALPYAGNDLSNCFSGNSVDFDPCGSTFLFGNDYVFTYTSPGDECITVNTSGTDFGAGVGVYTGCPDLAGSECIVVNGGAFGGQNPSIASAFLETPGTYYIMFSSSNGCTPFSISVDTITCPILLPPASTCDEALDISGCSNEVPEIIALNPGQGDPNFIQQGVNQGCFVVPQENYAFFYFVAGADGKFGFTVEAADPAEATDIDINVWGPIPSVDQICDYTANNQPVRSTWTGGTQSTGLEDIHPVTGITVTDDFDCGDPGTPGAGGDRFVRRLDVLEGELYVILLDDFGGAIESGGISIEFNSTSDGVLDPSAANVFAGPDTAVCVGQAVQLLASGGEAYSWSPDETLSCSSCPNPITAPLTESIDYVVQIVTTCGITPVTVSVDVLDLDLGPDVTVCNGAEFQLNPNPFPNVQYNWFGGVPLSCSDCPTPTVSGLATGSYIVLCELTSSFCTSLDTLIINVLPGVQPQYDIASDTIVCAGNPIALGGPNFLGTTYSWSSVPVGFASNDSNPIVNPATTTKYFVTASNGVCPVVSVDSVLVTVNEVPQISVANDTIICQGQSVTLGTTDEQNNATYSWTTNFGSIDQPNTPNPIVTPAQTSVFVLQATIGVCTEVRTVNIGVIPIFLQLNVADTVRICQGTAVNIQANVVPFNTPVIWSPTTNLQVAPNNLSAVATPNESILYTVSASVPGCTRTQTVQVNVDSLPANLDISPSDTMVCFGSKVLLRSPIYEPAEYQFMDFTWSPQQGQLTPDSLFNLFVQPTETTIYQRITRNGACLDTATAVVNIIPIATMEVTPPNPAVCPGVPVQLNLTYTPGVTEIEWSPATGLSCTDCDNPVATVTQTTTYTVEGNFMGCVASTSVTVSIATPAAFDFPDDTNLCAGESLTLNTITDPTATYSWVSTDPTFNQNNVAQPNITPTQSGTYTVTANNGCTSTGTVTVTVTDATLTVSDDVSACRNVPVSLTALGTLPGDFTWSGGGVSLSGQAINVLPPSTTTYTVVYTYGDGCTKTDNIVVTITGEAPPLELPIQTSLCPSQSILLNNGNVPAGATYTWTATPADPTLGATSGNPTVAPTQNTTYSVTATQGNCTNTATINVEVLNATLNAGADLTICLGDNAQLTATASTQGNFTWNPTGTSGATLTDAPTLNTTYSVVFEYGNNCILTDAVMVMVVPSFEVNIEITPSDTIVDLGEQIELIAEITPGTGIQNYQFQWLENNVTSVGTTQVITPIISTTDDDIRYVVIVTSPGGCVRTEIITLAVERPEIVMPNAFTPDNDTVNDGFGPVALKGSATLVQFDIYNRWGQKIFSAEPGGPVENARWDGKVDGKDAPVDVYIYQLQYRFGDGALQAPLSGGVTLLR
jgi:gliding motility-associated-like protein